MRFFKYFIFFVFSVISFNIYAAKQYVLDGTFSSAQVACSSLSFPVPSRLKIVYKRYKITSPDQFKCFYDLVDKDTSTVAEEDRTYTGQIIEAQECWHPDYKIVSQNVNNKQIKSSICVSNNGSMCKYVGSVKNVTAINGYISTVFNSVSKTPDPNCKEDLVNAPCDPKDPYGGCYTPPNQECTRQFDGSIVCPEEKEPPIEQGCNGADYCNRPPQGCGEGYVSGTYNGERISA